MKQNLPSGLGDEEKPGPAFSKEKYTFRGVSLVHDYRLDQESAPGCASQNHVAVGR
jgi:hypothetical protein